VGASRAAGFSAFPHRWEHNGKSGIREGLSRDEYLFARALEGLLANPALADKAPEELIGRARRIVDLGHEDLDRAFTARTGSGGHQGGDSGWGA
jgi:hypothetical protein